MQHTAHHAIKTRLNMWRMFFATGNNSTPEGADDTEYGLDDLIDLAREGDSAELHLLADRVERMGQEYMLKLDDHHAEQNDRYAAAMMRDHTSADKPQAVTMADIEAVLAGNASW